MRNKFLKPVKRRDFIKQSMAGGMVAATLPLWKLYPGDLPDEIPSFYSSFGLEKENIENLLETALQSGGDFAEIYAEYTINNGINLEEDKIHSATRGIDMGVGIRVLKGEKTGYAHSDDLNPDKLKDAAAKAGLIAAGKAKNEDFNLRKGKIPSYYMVNVSPESIVAQEKSKLLWKTNSVARSIDKRINQVSVNFRDINKKIVISNSDGIWVEDAQTITRLIVFVNAIENEKRSRGYTYKGGTLGYEHFTMEAAEELAKDACRIALAMLPAEDAPAGEYPIVMAKGHCGTFFHEAIGHSLEGDGARKKTSCFWDKKGKMIASEIVSCDG